MLAAAIAITCLPWRNTAQALKRRWWPRLLVLWLMVMGTTVALQETFYLGAPHLTFLLACCILFYYGAIGALSQRDRRSIMLVMILVAIAQSSFCVLQRLGLDPLFGHVTETFQGAQMTQRIIGTIGYQNTVAYYLVVLAPITFYFALSMRKPLGRITLLAATVMIVYTIVLTRSRGALLAAAFAFLPFALYCLRNRRRMLIALLAGFVGVTVLVAWTTRMEGDISLTHRLRNALNTQSPALMQRQLIWKTTTRMIREQPLKGNGLGSFERDYLDALGATLESPQNAHLHPYALNVKDAHNDYLQMWSEAGLVGLVSWLLFLVSVLFALIRQATSKNNQSDDPLLSLGASGSLLAFLVAGLVSFPLHVTPVAPILWTVLGLALNRNTLDPPVKARPRKGYTFAIIPGSIVIGVGLAATVLALFSDFYFNQAQQDATETLSESANHRYIKAIRLRPHDGRLRFFYGSHLLSIGHNRDALSQLQSAESTFTDINLWRNLARALHRCERDEEALAYLKRAARTNIDRDAVLFEIALHLIRMKRYDAAVDTIETLQHNNQIQTNMLCMLARQFLQAGETEHAILTLRKFTTTKETKTLEFAFRWDPKGKADNRYVGLTRVELPIDSNSEIRSLVLPTTPHIRILAITLSQSGRGTAITLDRHFNRRGIAYRSEPRSHRMTFDDIGYVLPAEQFPTGDSIPIFSGDNSLVWRPGSLNTNSLNTIATRGQLVEVPTGHYDRLFILCASVNSPVARRDVIRLVCDQKNILLPIKVSDWCTPVNNEYSHPPAVIAESLDLLGVAWLMRENPRIAAHQLERALMNEPENVSVMNNIAASLRLLGKTDEAVSLWNRVLTIAPDNATAKRNLSGLHAPVSFPRP